MNRIEESDFDILFRAFSSISNVLRDERIYRNITQESMAEKMGVSRNTVSRIECGRNTNFKMIQAYILTLKGIDILAKSE